MTIQLEKPIMRVGTFSLPNGKGTFQVTRERLDHWAKTFQDMWKRKINVPVVVDHIVDTFHTVGRIVGMKRSGDYLLASLEFPTQEFANLTKVNDVSIGSKNILVTGVKTYRDGLEHVSLTPRPVVPDLGEYSLLCSLGDYTGKESQTMNYLDKILESIASFMGVAVPEEAKTSEEAAYTFISTVLSCAAAAGEGKGDPTPSGEGDGGEGGEGGESAPPGEKGDDGEKTPGEDEIVASLNQSRKTELQSFLGRGGINASLLEAWQKQHCQHKTVKSFCASVPAFTALTEGLRCSLGTQDDILKTRAGTQAHGSSGFTAKPSLFMQRAQQRAKRG